MDSPQHHAPVRVLTHIKRLDNCFGQFLVRVIRDRCACRACVTAFKLSCKDSEMPFLSLDAGITLG